MPKGIPQAKAMLNSKKYVVLAIDASVRQSDVCRKFCYIIFNKLHTVGAF